MSNCESNKFKKMILKLEFKQDCNILVKKFIVIKATLSQKKNHLKFEKQHQATAMSHSF